MTYTLCLPEGEDEALLDIARAAHQPLVLIADQLGLVADIKATLVFADDFAAAVQSELDALHLDIIEPGGFTTERLGGVVAAKNIGSADGRSASIVFQKDLLGVATKKQEILSYFLIAHELCHPILNRLRVEATKDGASVDLSPGQLAAVRIIESALDELRCDQIAYILLNQVASATSNGEPVPAITISTIAGTDDYDDLIREALDTAAWPGWRDCVQDYRAGAIGLGDMWDRIRNESSELFVLFSHAEAERRMSGQGGALEAASTHPGVEALVGAVWTVLTDGVREYGLLPDSGDMYAHERAVVDPAADALIAMWGKLGIALRWTPDRHLYIDVSEPTI